MNATSCPRPSRRVHIDRTHLAPFVVQCLRVLLIVALVFSQSALAARPTAGKATAGRAKVYLCHIPPGNPENAQILKVGAASVQKHIEHHGDYLLADALEVCDGRDNDCDREIDEGFLDLGVACSDGVGMCQQSGVRVCRPDGTGTVCDAVPLDPPLSTEDGSCDDGLDNDCDEATDWSSPDFVDR